MGSLVKAMRPIRIIALPLTRMSKASDTAALRQSLVYYHFQITKPADLAQHGTNKKEGAENGSLAWSPKGGWPRWVTAKASNAWAKLGKAKEGSWKVRVYQLGERFLDRIDFEELALKGIDPSFGPSIRHPDFGGHSQDDVKNKPPLKIPFLYPPSIQNGPTTLSQLTTLVQHRGPNHRKGFLTWMLITPLTAPFMIIPIIPNLPFFFCVWRSWHHYKAYRASQYVQALLESGSIIPEPSKELDRLYERYRVKENAQSSHPTPSHPLLISRDAVPPIIETFGLEVDDSADIYRAIQQAEVRSRGEKGGEGEEKTKTKTS
ncbi:hypothetical protein PC9H_010809 [Pleurotus ostreatus]|uniref:Mitochondrial K+-H+ exchange-related-domain-containing protein n=1 Tax=Pleurotus ostreatus TaxID=5322 RepID=A0A8H7DRF0_PLEOS|nr:uncharacterized protein PC9H_010809 [Pleurotus ostreatus]KAF7422653.1 hypothetical protein PC9H_010809 [Pleurotus ostreatus]KAJ8691460.1 hypothetical protein PTI98_011029 [Pleurotus ostreatus]